MSKSERHEKPNTNESDAVEQSGEWAEKRMVDYSYLRPEKKENDSTIEASDEAEESGAEPIEQVDTGTPSKFGIFAHQAYVLAAEAHFEDVLGEELVSVEDKKDSAREGRVDICIDGNRLFDFKTHNMRDWSMSKASREGDEHGRQMRGYLDSQDTPSDSRGWIVATVPPESDEVRSAYKLAVGAHDVDVIFAAGEQPSDVIEAIEEVIDDERPHD